MYVWLILHHMLVDRVRIGEEKRKINDLRSECIAAFTHRRRQAKYSSSSPSHCSIVLRGEGLSRHAGWPKGAYHFSDSTQPKCVSLDFFSHPLLAFLYIFISTGPLNKTIQVQSPYNIWAHTGPWCTGACSVNGGAACSVQTNGPLDLSLMLEREKEWDIAPRAPSCALCSAAPGIPDATSPFHPAHHPWGMLSAHVTLRKSIQRSAPVSDFPTDLISSLWASYGNAFPSVCLSLQSQVYTALAARTLHGAVSTKKTRKG